MRTRESERKRFKANYQWYKSHGICVRCYNAPATPGRITCPECRARHRAYCNAVKDEYSSKGICWQCKVNPVEEGHKVCRACMDKNAARYRKKVSE